MIIKGKNTIRNQKIAELVANKEEFYNSIPPSCRPKKKPRPLGSRSDAELRRLSYACSVAVEKALQEGYFNLTKDGKLKRIGDYIKEAPEYLQKGLTAYKEAIAKNDPMAESYYIKLMDAIKEAEATKKIDSDTADCLMSSCCHTRVKK